MGRISREAQGRGASDASHGGELEEDQMVDYLEEVQEEEMEGESTCRVGFSCDLIVFVRSVFMPVAGVVRKRRVRTWCLHDLIS